MKPNRERHYTFNPYGLDIIDPKWKTYGLVAGEVVRKIQPAHAPKNGTMDHCYVQSVASGQWCLVSEHSLSRTSGSGG